MSQVNWDKGMRCYILRSNTMPDCSNGGISNRVSQVTLVGPGIPQIFDVTDDAPAVVLTNTAGNYICVTPLAILTKREHAMAGGTFIWSSDSHFPHDYPLSLHDRVERPPE